MQLDKELQADVIRELEWEPKVDSANVGVAVDKGAVTLTGHVNTYTELIAAERAALRVYGVLAVANELVVKLAGDRTRDDSDIALAISNQMTWNAAIPHLSRPRSRMDGSRSKARSTGLIRPRPRTSS
jgi:BON domain